MIYWIFRIFGTKVNEPAHGHAYNLGKYGYIPCCDILFIGNSQHELTGLHWAIKLRLVLLLPRSCKWNAFVRNLTAWMEVKL